ncbi:MAG: diaminopimelate epimerase [Deltaproteobacteria bacterium]|nr:diaminopimelate epimerase [Deltaproteobacteria bacterium]
MEFWKMHGLGNSFVVINDLEDTVENNIQLSTFAKKICHPGFGIGADGLILLKKSLVYDFKMVIYNEDGSEAEMCGNGIRCLSKFVHDNGLNDNDEFLFETLAGKITTRIKENNLIEVDMGSPEFLDKGINVENNSYKKVDDSSPLASVECENRSFNYVSMGNPHAISFVEDFNFDWKADGQKVENSTHLFPARTNVEFIKIENSSEITMKVWERGCGETLACGTGACASVVAAVEGNYINKGEVTVHLLGGDLKIKYFPGDAVLMTGPADIICKGILFI